MSPAKASWPRRIAGLVVAALLIGAIVYGFLPQAPLVDAFAVERAALRVSVREEARTRVKDRYVLSAPVPGYTQRLSVKVGDTVERGQVLLEIEPLRSTLLDPRTRAETRARVQVAQARLKVSEEQARAAASEAKLAQSELKRVEELYQKGASTRAELDRLRSAARAKVAMRRSGEFAVDVARHELEVAQAAVGYSSKEEPTKPDEQVRVTAPLSAKVLRVLHESAGVVAAGTPIVELGDPATLEIEAEVLSADAVRIRAGMLVVLDRWGGEGTLEGKVRRVEPVGFTKVSALGVEEQRVLVIVELTSPAQTWAALGDGYRVEATFVLWESDDVLQVPNSALFRGAGGWQVYVVRDGVARATSVELGQRNGLRSEVTSGLEAGESVITHPSDQVSEGVAVRVRSTTR